MVMALNLLTGCNSIEHRSESIQKKPLPPLAQDKTAVQPQLVWCDSRSSGSKKAETHLRLAVSDPLVINADHRGHIFAFDQQKGTLKWQVDSKAKITAGPAVVDGRILVGTDDARVLAYQSSTGAFLWQAKVTAPVLSAPQGNRGVVFVHALDGHVLALNAENGRQLWAYAANLPPVMLRRGSSPAFIDNHVLVGLANGKLTALHRLDGQPDWEREIAISKGRSDIQRMVDISADPLVADNTIYAVSYQGRLMALKPDMGEPLWEKEMSSFSGLAVNSKVLFVTDARGVLWAIDRKTGNELWKQADLTGRHLSAPAVLKDMVIVGDDEGYLHWFSEKDGSWITRQAVDNKGIHATPLVKDDKIYVLGRSGKMAVYTMAPGVAANSQESSLTSPLRSLLKRGGITKADNKPLPEKGKVS
jgi:outer membrane protein assembly factor BamB